MDLIGAPPALLLDRLTKRYGDRLAVDSLSLTVAPGEVVGFLGPNGAGKTTTIRMACGLLRPTSGRALVAGIDITLEPRRAKALIGYCPDQPALYEKLTGRQMIEFSADLFSVPRARQAAAIEPMLAEFVLLEHADELVQSYSRGMRQKLALCCALIHDPVILFLDEPTVGLDPASARQLKEVIAGLRQGGRSVFLSTHVLEVAERVCDRVAIVDRGRILHIGTPAEIGALVGESTLEDAFLRLTGSHPVRAAV